MEHQGTVTLETPRLILRKSRIEDADAMFANWASDPEVTRYLTWPAHGSVEITRKILSGWAERNDDPAFYQWMIVPKELGEPVGCLSIVHMREETSECYLGWCIGKKWWGQGIMPEAARAVLAYLFEAVGFERVAAEHDTENQKSGRVMQKIGMRLEGIMRKADLNNRGVVDKAVYAILREDYEMNEEERR